LHKRQMPERKEAYSTRILNHLRDVHRSRLRVQATEQKRV
jgi:hypothetical protein